MQKLINASYHFELVDENPDHYKYDFVSRGAIEVPKRVSVRSLNYAGFYNLGFGNLSVNAEGLETVDDTCRKNNRQDADLVLNTALLCGVHFLVSIPDTKLIFYGNTVVKHRLYLMKIASRIDELSEFFVIKGGVIDSHVIRNDQGFKIGLDPKIDPQKVAVEEFKGVGNCKFSFLMFEIRK